jgi:hypothetical protein
MEGFNQQKKHHIPVNIISKIRGPQALIFSSVNMSSKLLFFFTEVSQVSTCEFDQQDWGFWGN